MPYDLPIPEHLRKQGWKIKVLGKERLEAPHATVRRRRRQWRFDLRNLRFLDSRPSPRDLPREVLALLEGRRDELAGAWDRMYPGNPVGGLGD